MQFTSVVSSATKLPRGWTQTTLGSGCAWASAAIAKCTTVSGGLASDDATRGARLTDRAHAAHQSNRYPLVKFVVAPVQKFAAALR